MLGVLSAGVNVYRDNLISFAWVEFILEFATDIPNFFFFILCYFYFILNKSFSNRPKPVLGGSVLSLFNP